MLRVGTSYTYYRHCQPFDTLPAQAEQERIYDILWPLLKNESSCFSVAQRQIHAINQTQPPKEL
jgi:hypothetical protein